MSFLDIIIDGLRRDPSRAALVGVTAGDLLGRAAALRAGLAARGVGPGDRVALLGKSSPDWIACDLATLASGAALVPLDPRQDARERRALIADADPKLVVTDDAANLPDLPGGAVTLDALAAPHAGASWPARTTVAGSAPATIIYTSGSTGEPKGAVLTWDNLEFMLRHTTARLERLTGQPWGADRCVQVLPPCYAGSRVLLLSSLMRGARVRLVNDPKALGAAIEEERPHYVLTVPLILERIRRAVHERVAARGAALARLLREAEAAWARVEEGGAGLRDRLVIGLCRVAILRAVKKKLGPDLRIICGSAPLLPEPQRFFHLLGVPVYQGYGLTETTALCTLDVEGRVRTGHVGPALPGVELRLDPGGQLLARGPNVFAGYWRRPAGLGFTADGWFETGDLAEVDEDGRWRITGRRSAVLALSTGHKVPPEPLEDALRDALGGDAQVVVLGHGKPHVVALVAGPGLTEPQVAAAIERHNAACSPAKAVRGFALLEQPFTTENGLLTPNLKLRRAAILARHQAQVERLYARVPVAR